MALNQELGPEPATRRAGRRRAVRVPTILQMEAAECGAACLTMVLAHHGRHLPLEEVRAQCDVTRDGTKASNLVNVARWHGLRAKGYRKSVAALRDMPCPAILHWNFQHFVVLEGFVGERARINDPAMGRCHVSAAELDDAFTGVVLAFEPDESFERTNRKPRLGEAVRRRLRGSQGLLAIALVAAGGVAAASAALPAITRAFVDGVAAGGRVSTDLWLLLAALLVAGGGLAWVQQQRLLQLERRLALDGARELFWHLLHLPMEFFTQRFAGDVASRIRQNDRLAQLLGTDLSGAVLHLVVASGLFVLMARYDARLALVLLGLALANAAALRASARARHDAGRVLLQQQAKLVSTTAAGLAGIDTLKATGEEDEFHARWAGFLARVINEEQRHALRTRLLTALTAGLLPLSAAVVLGLGVGRVAAGEMTVGTLVAFQLLAAGFFVPVAALARAGTLVQEAASQVSRLEDVLRYPRMAAEAPEAVESAEPLAGAVQLRNVSFGYARLGTPLVSALSLDIAAGARVALVGGTGSGKSTVARILCGLYEPWFGKVLLDGVPREQLPPARIARSLAFVDQEVMLFEGTLRENLALRGQPLDDYLLWEALSDAGMAIEISARAGGLDTHVAEGGINFSGGQRQRLELARALVQQPTILVLDEATSALDAAIEQHVLDAVRRRGITCVMVAHRLATVMDCDEIVVLQDGTLVERGTHDALLAQGGAYAALVASE